MKKILLLSTLFSVAVLNMSAASKVGDIVDLTPTIKGEVIKVNGTNVHVEIYANPDNEPSGDLDIPYFYTNTSYETLIPVRIAPNGFKSCQQITSVKVGGGVEYIGANAFYGCTALKSFTEATPGSVESVGQYAFYRTTALEKIDLPGVYTINEYAFDSSGIKSANFPEIQYLYGAAFYECKNLETFTGGEKLKQIGNIAFCQDAALKQVNIGPDLTSIGSMAFAFCSSLQDIVIPEGCSSVAKDAFSGIALKRVFILNPKCMDWLDQSKLVRDKSIETIYCRDELVYEIKYYISVGSEENNSQFLASQAEIKPLSDLVALQQVEGDQFETKIGYNDISALSVFNPETGSEYKKQDGVYTIEGDQAGLRYRVDWNNLLKYTVTLDRSSSISIIEDSNVSTRRYFNLNGQEVTNPEKGIYIVKEKGKNRKIIL